MTKCAVEGSILDLNTTGIGSFCPFPTKGGVQAQENQEVSHVFVGGTHVCVGCCLYGSINLIVLVVTVKFGFFGIGRRLTEKLKSCRR